MRPISEHLRNAPEKKPFQNIGDWLKQKTAESRIEDGSNEKAPNNCNQKEEAD